MYESPMLPDASDTQSLAALRAEHRAVATLLSYMDLPVLQDWMKEPNDATPDRTWLTFWAFRRQVGTFPILLDYRPLYGLDSHETCSLSAMLKQPWNSLIFRAWVAARDSLDDPPDRPFGLVFPFSGIRGGMVLHDGPPGLSVTRTTDVVRRRLSFDAEGRSYRLERYWHLLAAIRDSDWTHSPPSASPVHPAECIRRVRGAGPKLVLQFLLQVAAGAVEPRPDWQVQAALVRRLDGRRWVCISRQEIAQALGLHTEQVRRALRSLRESRAIEQRRHGQDYLYTFHSPHGDPS